jgi:hypothetical protein
VLPELGRAAARLTVCPVVGAQRGRSSLTPKLGHRTAVEWAKECSTKQVLWGGWPARWVAYSFSIFPRAQERG